MSSALKYKIIVKIPLGALLDNAPFCCNEVKCFG